jgi:hypothetical protein
MDKRRNIFKIKKMEQKEIIEGNEIIDAFMGGYKRDMEI